MTHRSFVAAGLLVLMVGSGLRADYPPVLRMADGAAVTTEEAWRTQRRPELAGMFERWMYGRVPAEARQVTVKAREVGRSVVLGGKAVMKRVELTLERRDGRDVGRSVGRMELLMFLPAEAKGQVGGPVERRVPMFVGINFCGNQSVFEDGSIPLTENYVAWGKGIVDHRATEASRGQDVAGWPVAAIIERGYGLATFHAGDIDPDRADFSDGVQAQFYREGQTGPGDEEWGSIGAWAWGLSRAADYLMTDAQVDAQRVMVIGFSRYGKTALWAGAMDERFAMVVAVQAGCGGTAPSRGTVGESVKVITTKFPHWFCGEFAKFGDRVEELPMDQHGLMAMVAPRPLLVTAATGDEWSNPAGQYEMARLAGEVYRLLGVDGPTGPMPGEDEEPTTRLGFFIRAGKHSQTEQEWKAAMDFADRHLGR
jgi:hypothetical protein